MQGFIIKLLTCSITMSALALFYVVITPLLEKRCSAKGRYYAWLFIVVGLIIPFRPQFNNAIVKVDIPIEAVTPIIKIGNGTPVAATVNTAALPPSLPSISIWHIVFAVWLAGMIIFLAYHVIKHYRFLKLAVRWSENIADERILALFQNISAETGIYKPIGLKLCASAGSPMMIGFANPQILLPKLDFSQDELRFILKHELVHYKRKDLWYKGLVLIASAIHWFNPISYLMVRAIDAQCELSCDEEIVRGADADTRQLYTKTIIGVIIHQSKLKTALSTNFYGGKKGMKKRIFSIMDVSKKNAGTALICGALIITIGTGLAFTASASTPQANGNTAILGPETTYVMSAVYERYKEYGLTFDKETDNLYFNGELVRYFEDYYPVSDGGSAGFDYFNKNGTVDVRGVRDLSQITRNADGSYDPSGKLTGVEPYSQAEFDARDIEKLINPPQSSTVAYAENNMSYSDPKNQGRTISQIISDYKDYGITFDENSITGGLGNVYYQGQLVKTFIDEKPSGGVFSLSSSDGGNIKVRTVYDENEKLTGVEVVS